MNCGAPLRDLGALPCPGLVDRVQALPEGDWDLDPHRQQAFRVHQQTRSIRLLWTDLATWPVVESRVMPTCAPFESDLRQVVSESCVRLGRPVTLMNAVLARLDAGGEIPEHVDSAPFFEQCHRLHWPVIVPDEARLVVDGEAFSVQAGRLYEINNRLRHGARNPGPGPRVHLILDLAPT